jgi:hypothetical protein
MSKKRDKTRAKKKGKTKDDKKPNKKILRKKEKRTNKKKIFFDKKTIKKEESLGSGIWNEECLLREKYLIAAGTAVGGGSVGR